jgi:hypothetical protein
LRFLQRFFLVAAAASAEGTEGLAPALSGSGSLKSGLPSLSLSIGAGAL